MARATFLLAVVLAGAVAGCAASPAAGSHFGTAMKHVPSGAGQAPGSPPAQIATFLQSAYARSDWAGVKHVFLPGRIDRSLLTDLRSWESEQVHPLHVSLDFMQRSGANSWIATLEFSSDPRAIPAYATYTLQRRAGVTRIMGRVTGLRGRDYLHANWSVTRTAHFIVYHGPYTLRGSDRRFLALLEQERSIFMRKFGVQVASHIAFYYYPEQRLMAPMTMRTCGTSPGFVGCADPYARPPVIQSSEWPSYHEPVHIYQAALAPPPPNRNETYVDPLFIAEGMAVALEDRQLDPTLSDYCSDLSYVPLDSCAQQSIGDVRPISLLRDTGFKKADPGDAYSLGGSFVKYLILTFGYRPFGRFYYVLAAQPSDREKDYDVASQAVYHKSIRQLLAGWRAHLCTSVC